MRLQRRDHKRALAFRPTNLLKSVQAGYWKDAISIWFYCISEIVCGFWHLPTENINVLGNDLYKKQAYKKTGGNDL